MLGTGWENETAGNLNLREVILLVLERFDRQNPPQPYKYFHGTIVDG